MFDIYGNPLPKKEQKDLFNIEGKPLFDFYDYKGNKINHFEELDNNRKDPPKRVKPKTYPKDIFGNDNGVSLFCCTL